MPKSRAWHEQPPQDLCTLHRKPSLAFTQTAMQILKFLPSQLPFVHTLPSQAKRLHSCCQSHSTAYRSFFSSDPPPVASEISINVSSQHRHSLKTQQPLLAYFLLWTAENTILPITRYSRVHMVLKGQDDRVERCFKSTFCNGLNGILNERQWSEKRSALINNRDMQLTSC